ncbi:uncharacterized protein LOC116804948 [Drosophila grimshawi]|uniref:uncharacterized protein LOC116804948 n=1 Tax=Drosophila grimshawi TaxID=7222 RepID=UPI0013EEF465|nr:uncharacterized protein LOC116804948 [Drosophila grimshawi]
MIQRATLYFIIAFVSCLLLEVNALRVNLEKESQQRTTLPLLLLLSNPLALPLVTTGGLRPGVPLRRPQGGSTQDLGQVSSDVKQMDEVAGTDANDQIREQFIQGVLQGLQSMSGPGPTIQPAVLADFLQQAMASETTSTQPVQKLAHRPISDESSNDNDPDYDYIDFKNGSRIQYELDNDQQLNNTTIQQPAAVAPLNYGYYSSQLFG